MANKEFSFGEKDVEQIWEDGETIELRVWKSPKYLESKKKAIEILKSGKYKGIEESDFWILMNKTKSSKMAYTGLILSHNGCLKINDCLEEKLRFKPSCLKRTQNEYAQALVYEYCNDEQGIFEVGEVTAKNCKNAYPFAMALKRCFDRVVLKNSKLAYSGIYSDSEADEFKNQLDDIPEASAQGQGGPPEAVDMPKAYKKITKEQIAELRGLGFTEERFARMAEYYEVKDVADIPFEKAKDAIRKTKGSTK